MPFSPVPLNVVEEIERKDLTLNMLAIKWLKTIYKLGGNENILSWKYKSESY